MKRTAPEDGRIIGDENSKEWQSSPSSNFTDDLRSEKISEMSGVTAALVTKLGLGSWHNTVSVIENCF